MSAAEQVLPSGDQRRRGRPGHDQKAVLRAAVDLFNRQGYDATSVGDLARELGLTKSAIYHHVDSKEALLSAALDEALGALTAAIDAARGAPGATAYERLQTVVHASVEILAAHLPAVTLLLRVRGNSAIELAALARRRALDDDLANLVADAVAEGSLRPGVSPELLSRLLFGMVNSLAEWYRPGGPFDPGLIADAVVTLAFDGLRVPERG
ncbi:MAG: TetR/AcrR family transcriptional regulator [Jatrophihabitans sp.]